MSKAGVLLLTAAAVLSAQAQTANGLRGFPAEQARAHRALEEKARAVPQPANIRAYMEKMAAEPHHAGSPGSRKVAEYAAGLLKSWGLEAEIEELEALLPYPTVRLLEMTAPRRYQARLAEPVLAEDPDSGDTGQLPTYNAYSASGDVTGPVVYVNYGIPEDYEELNKRGIDVKGKIVLARYGRSWRGTKAKVAQEHGAVGCLIYSDPRDDGFFQGDVYPKGPFRPEHGVQRGSVMDMPLYTGDPLTPGWASEKGAKKLDRAEAKSLMRIPVLPISYGDALPFLKALEGPVAPEAWRGALPVTYHIGPGPAVARLKLDFDWKVRPLYNVIATIPGSEASGEWVIYGNHHDAWVNGADDPVSGAAALLETARALAEMRKQGWKPRRTIRFALWDGEEFGLLGSTEHAEKHREALSAKGVAYFNSDSNGKGAIGAGGAPTLEAFMIEVLRDVTDPESGKSVLEKARERRPAGAAAAAPRAAGSNEFRLGPLGAGSDYVGFYHHIGMASVNLGFSGGSPGGIYHSIYDSMAWYTKFSDKDFVYGQALARVMATALSRMADAPVLPFEFSAFYRNVNSYIDDLRKLQGAGKVDLRELTSALDRLAAAASLYEAQVKIGRWHGADAAALAKVNAVLYRCERALLAGEGLPGRSWYKHLLSAPGMYTGYGAKTLPVVREAIEAGKPGEAQAGVAPLARAVDGLRERIEEATRLLGAM